jgi:hypothetical protein
MIDSNFKTKTKITDNMALSDNNTNLLPSGNHQDSVYDLLAIIHFDTVPHGMKSVKDYAADVYLQLQHESGTDVIAQKLQQATARLSSIAKDIEEKNAIAKLLASSQGVSGTLETYIGESRSANAQENLKRKREVLGDVDKRIDVMLELRKKLKSDETSIQMPLKTSPRPIISYNRGGSSSGIAGGTELPSMSTVASANTRPTSTTSLDTIEVLGRSHIQHLAIPSPFTEGRRLKLKLDPIPRRRSAQQESPKRVLPNFPHKEGTEMKLQVDVSDSNQIRSGKQYLLVGSDNTADELYCFLRDNACYSPVLTSQMGQALQLKGRTTPLKRLQGGGGRLSSHVLAVGRAWNAVEI